MKIITLLFLSFFGLVTAQVTTVIGSQTNNGGFEQNINGWNFQSDSGQNKWVLGAVPTVGFTGGNCAFISNSISFPLNHQYTTSSSSITKLYRNVIFPANTSNYNLKFKVLVQGNTYDAKLDVYLLPTSTVLNVNTANYGTPLATYQMLGNSWLDKSISISNSFVNNSANDVTKQLVFIWSNSNSNGTQPPAAIDDVTIDNCTAPTNITNIAAPNQLNLNWDSQDTAWEIRYKIDTANSWTTINTTNKPFIISGLPTSTSYKLQIKNANLSCNDWSSEFVTSTTPINGSCANAIDIQGQDDINAVLPIIMNFTGSTLGAPQPQCNNTFSQSAKEVWYKFTATTTRYIIDSNSDLKVEIYSGSCGNLTFLTCKNGVSYIENVVVGNQYYIRFISDILYNNQINFRFLKSPQPPINDLCTDAIPLTNTTTIYNLTGSTFDTTPPLGNLYGNVLGDVWFKFVATENFASISAGSQNSGFGSPNETLSISLYTGSCNNLVLFQNFSTFDNFSGGSTKNTNLLQVGTTYYVRVSSQSGMAKNRLFGIKVTPIASPTNDLCVNATLLTLNSNGSTDIFASNIFATPSIGLSPLCLSNDNNDVWFKFIATSTKYLVKSNLTFGIYSGICSNLVQINCGTNLVLTNLNLGQTYYIRAAGNTINIREFEAADECTNASTLIPSINPDYVYSSTINATPSNIPSTCNSQTNDVWFQFVATSSKHRIELDAFTNSILNIDLYFGACAGQLNQVPCIQIYTNGGLIYKNLIVGQTYYVKVSRADNIQFGIRIKYIFVAPNDEIQNAIQIVPSAPNTNCTLINGSTSGSEPSINLNDSCQFSANTNNDVWYSFIATSDAYKLILSSGGSFYASLYKEINTNVIQNFSCDSSSFYGFTPGVKYFIRISQYSGSTAFDFSFCISEIVNRPVNDNCANAINVLTSPTPECSISYDINFNNCTYDLVNPINNSCVYSSYGVKDDIWYKFTASANKMLITNTLPINSTNNNAILRYTLFNNCSQLNCVSQVNSLDPSEKSFLNNLVIGNEYLIRMEKINDPVNIISFCISVAPTITNDEIVNAKILVPSANLTCNSLETNVRNIATPSQNLNVSGCASNFNSYLGAVYNDAWYKFVATNTEHVLDFEYVPYGLIVQLFSGTTTNLVCQNNTVILSSGTSVTGTVLSNLAIGTTYYIRLIESVSNATSYSTYKFCLKTPLPIPVNDEYNGAINLIPSSNLDICNSTSAYFNRSTHTSNVAQPTCALGGNCNEDVWFKFTATSESHQLHVYNNNPNATNVNYMTTLYGSQNNIIQQELACFNPFPASGSLSVPIEGYNYYPLTYQNYNNLIIGNTYYVRMYQFVDLSDYDFKIPVTYNICLKTLPQIPVNNSISTAINISSNSTTTPQYINGYATRGKYLSNTVTSTTGTNCYELNSFAVPANGASNAWYKFTANQTSYQLNVINDANVLFPVTNYVNYSYYPLIASLYQYDNTILKVKDCGLNTASNIILNNLQVGKEYYIKLMYPAITYLTDFEFQIGLSDVTLGTQSFDLKNSLILAPNPAKDFLNVKIPNNIEIKTIEILNILGQKIIKQEFNTEEINIDVSRLQQGTHLIKIKSKNGEINSKFIKS